MHKKFALATCQLLVMSASLTAIPDQMITWNGLTSENWSDPTNWTSIPPGESPNDGCDMTFPASGVTRFISNNDEFVQPNSMTINPPNGGSYTLMGNPVNVSSSILIAGGDANSTVDIQLPLNGTAGLTMENTGTLILEGVFFNGTDYSGDTLVRSGTLQAGADFGFSFNSAVILGDGLSSSATLDLNNHIVEILTLADYAATSGTVLLGSGTLVIVGENDTTYYGSISGTGKLEIGVESNFGPPPPPSALTLAGSNVVTYSGITQIPNGTLRAGADDAFSPHSAVALSNSVRESIGILDLNNFSNTIAGLDSDTNGGTVNLGSGTLTVVNTTESSFKGEIIGTGSLIKQGSGTLILDGISTYSGGTTILDGTLVGNTKTLQGSIDNQATLQFTLDNADGTFNGTIAGNGKVLKDGSKALTFSQETSNVADFNGTTFVNAGALVLNTTLGGGSTTVAHTGILKGIGIVQNNLTVATGGTIAPGNSIGTLNVGGNYSQHANTTYQVQIDETGASSLINVAGSASLEGGEVVVASTDGQYKLNTPYDILHAVNGLSGTFAGVSSTITDNTLVGAILSYDATDAFFSVQTTLVNAAETSNERAVAEQLDSIVNPNVDETLILNTLVGLSPHQASKALDQMTGQQYLSELLTTEITNRQFLKRLYDPVRALVTTVPCASDCCPANCELDFWFEVGGSRSFVRGNQHEARFTTSGFELAGGGQAAIASNLTVGVAAGYALDHVHYRGNGDGTNHTYLGGLYGLYRPCDYYVMADAIFGASDNKVKRHIDFGDIRRTAHSKPQIYEGTFYLEAGKDFCWECILVQPFLGVELSYAQRDKFSEHGADSLDLVVFKKHLFNAYGSLGLHLTQELCDDLALSVDLAWQYRFTERQDHLNERFRAFGTPFKIKGVSEERNSFEGAVTISKEIMEGWTLYGEFSGQRWERISSFNYLAGVEARW